MSSTIAGKHATFLIDGTAYTCTQVIADTQFESGVAAPSFADPTVTWVSGPTSFTWTYTPQAGDTSAYLSETGANW